MADTTLTKWSNIHNKGTNQAIKKRGSPSGSGFQNPCTMLALGLAFETTDLISPCPASKLLPTLLLLEGTSNARAGPRPTFLPSSPTTSLFSTFPRFCSRHTILLAVTHTVSSLCYCTQPCCLECPTRSVCLWGRFMLSKRRLHHTVSVMPSMISWGRSRVSFLRTPTAFSPYLSHSTSVNAVIFRLCVSSPHPPSILEALYAMERTWAGTRMERKRTSPGF